MKLKQISASLTSVTIVGNIHIGGNFPTSVNNAVTIPQTLEISISIMMFFAAVRPEDEFDDGDSTELGLLVVHRLYPHRSHPDALRSEINDIISVVNVLRSCQAKYRFLDEFLYHIIMNNMKRGAAQTGFLIGSPLAALTANEAGNIARSFVMVLISSVTGEAAVDEYIHTFPALGDLDEEFKWFRPSMVAIASELMGKVAYGVKVRATIGGSFSVLDMVSDCIIIIDYLAFDETTGYGHIMIGLVAANLFLQMLIVWLQTRSLKENKWKNMLLELLATVLFVKPGVDAWKVCSGAEQQPGAIFNPLMEMTCSKYTEMAVEGIPGFVLQSIAIISSAENRSPMAVISLMISAASVGLTATTLCYDIDVNPGMRKGNPVWCGIIPNQGRGLAFGVMFAFCTLHVLAKGFAAALFMTVSSSHLAYYMVADYSLYLLLFLARGDIVYFVATPPAVSWIVGPIVRVICKVLADFSGTPHMRLPLNMTGAYYLFNQFTAQASVQVAVHMYNVSPEPEEGGTPKIPAGTLWKISISLAVMWAGAFSFFLFRLVPPSHRHTFWSTVSGRQCVQANFLEGDTDEEKLGIFSCNRILFEADLGAKLMEFTHQNWARWEREKPVWFTPTVKASVPDEYIPREFLVALGGAGRMRRGSAAASVRESFRMSSREAAAN
jgi:hypothetical protein